MDHFYKLVPHYSGGLQGTPCKVSCRNISHRSDWSNVSLCPSPSFLSKNQLAKAGPDNGPSSFASPDPQLWIGPSSLTGPSFRLEHFATIWTVRKNKDVVFVSFKKGFDKDISPASVSSWIKETVILCYELSDQEPHSLKPVMSGPLLLLNVFQSGISLDLVSLPLK